MYFCGKRSVIAGFLLACLLNSAKAVPLETISFEASPEVLPFFANQTLLKRGFFKDQYDHVLRGRDGLEYECADDYPSRHRTWRVHIGIPPKPEGPEPPINVPTDIHGKIIHEPLDKYGVPLPGKHPDHEQCCRMTTDCWNMMRNDKRSMDILWQVDRLKYKKLNCCWQDYFASCPHPQEGRMVHLNQPPRCSNPWTQEFKDPYS